MRRTSFVPQSLTWLINKRYGAAVLVVLFFFALRQLVLSQMELDEVRDKREDYLAVNGAVGKKFRPSINRRLTNSSGLITKGLDFLLNGEKIRILGGSIHYFRFPSEYWWARLHALKASGLNTVTTYIAWNAHEPLPGTFDFSGMLNLGKFIQTAHDLELYVILRVGPYICAEWEWGGLPSWLLREDDIKVRTSDPVYMAHVRRWFDKLLPIIRPYQFRYGGPVIAVQVENEYASFPNYDPDYVPQLTKMITDGGIKEFLFACDDKNGVEKNLDYGNLLKTVNFQHKPAEAFKKLEKLQPNRPLFVSEYWTGWFNYWGSPDNNLGVPWLKTLNTEKFESNTKELLDAGGHMNMYMFAGGTNFGFMNGGMIMEKDRGNGDKANPDTTSYDYDALVSEEGLLKPKFYVTRNLLRNLQPNKVIPEPPPEPVMMSYESVAVSSFLSLSDLIPALKDWMIESKNPIPMEKFPGNGDRKLGQAYGYALYRTKVSGNPTITLNTHGKIRDRALVYLDGDYQGTIAPPKYELVVKSNSGTTDHVVSFLVENQGRVNWVSDEQIGTFENQRKGIIGNVECNGKVLYEWKTWPLEFDTPFLMKLDELTRRRLLTWHDYNPAEEISAPALLKAELILEKSTAKDTFVELEGFEKGILIVNGINLGRYWNSAGPQRRLFLPGVWLHSGVNEVLIFEESKVGNVVSFHKENGIRKAGEVVL